MADERIENQVDETEDEHEEEGERTFTQAEVDALIEKRLSRAKKGMPSDDELNEFREWKAKKDPDAAKKTTQAELDDALAEMEMTRRENWLLRKGIDPDDVDYYAYRISKTMDGDTDFEDAAEEFFKKHKTKAGVRMDTGARLNSGSKSKSVNDTMNDLIRNARK